VVSKLLHFFGGIFNARYFKYKKTLRK